MRNWTRSIACLLAGLTILLPATAQTKNEVVYASLHGDGTARGVYVVNRFEREAAGVLTDYGAYQAVVNLSDLSPIALSDGVVTVNAPAGTFYYQGTLEQARLPWDFSISYTLDGAPVAAAELGGRKGHVQMRICVTRRPEAQEAFVEHYTLQMSLTLGESCKNVLSPGATVANAGKKRQLTYMLLPGEDKTFDIALDAEEFSMSALTVNGVPLQLDVDGAVDTSDVKEQVGKLQDGIQDLDEGAGQLNSAARKLQKGAQNLRSGSGEVTEGIGQIKAGSTALVQGSAQVAARLEALSEGLDQYKNSARQIKEGGETLSAGARTLSQNLASLEEGLQSIKTASSAASQALGALSQAAGGCDGEIALLRALADKGAQNADVRAYLGAELRAIGKVLTILEGLDQGLSQLLGQYAQFDAALDQAIQSAQALKSAAGQLSSGVSAFTGPVVQLAGAVGDVDTSGVAQYAQFDAGVQKLDAAIARLQTSYKALDEGIRALDSGTDLLRDGTKELTGGTDTLRSETGDLDTRVDQEVDKALEKFRSDGFAPVSFVDARNQVALVQFVIRTDAIEVPEAPEAVEDATQRSASFPEKLAALFQGWGDKK